MKHLNYLNKYFYKYRYRLIWGTFCASIASLMGIIPAQMIGKSLDSIVQLLKNENSHSLSENIIQAIIWFSLIILAASLAKGVFMFFMRQAIIVMSRYIEYDLKNELFEHYQKLSTSFFKRHHTGDLMTRIGEDVSRVRMYVGPAIMYTIQTFTLFAFTIATMLLVNVKLTLIVLIPLPILSFITYYVSSQINRRSDDVQTQLSRLSTLTQETFAGIRVLKSYAKENSLYTNYEKESKAYKSKSLKLTKIEAFFAPTIMVLMGLSTILTIYIGGLQAINREITLGNIAEFVYYLNMLSWPVASIGWVSSLIQRAAASQERINAFLEIKPEIKNTSLEKAELKGSVFFKDVSFTYPDTGIKALKNVSFTIQSGECLGIVGKTGSGKSTIANLMVRLYDVTNGEIVIDNQNIQNIDLFDFRKNIGYVPQDVFLFSDTISNNVQFGFHKNSGNKENSVIKAVQLSNMYETIQEFPEKFETYIGERGVMLSGGQKQRLSIARAIIGSPKILIFDDCLSAVDTETEDVILTNLKNLMRFKTTIIISHRVSAVKNADKIIVLHSGEIIEKGKHEDLIEQGGFYAQLYRKQLMESTQY